jgi:hypothetical protein
MANWQHHRPRQSGMQVTLATRQRGNLSCRVAFSESRAPLLLKLWQWLADKPLETHDRIDLLGGGGDVVVQLAGG